MNITRGALKRKLFPSQSAYNTIDRETVTKIVNITLEKVGEFHPVIRVLTQKERKKRLKEKLKSLPLKKRQKKLLQELLSEKPKHIQDLKRTSGFQDIKSAKCRMEKMFKKNPDLEIRGVVIKDCRDINKKQYYRLILSTHL